MMKKLVAAVLTAYLAALPVAYAQEAQAGNTSEAAGAEGAGAAKHMSKFGSKKGPGKGKGHKSGHKGRGHKGNHGSKGGKK